MRRLVTAVSALLLIATLAPSAGAQDIRSGSDGKPGDPSMRPPSSRPRPPFRRGFFPCCVAYFPLEITLFNWLHGSILYVAPSPPTLVYIPTPRVEPAPEIQARDGRWERHGNGKEYPYTWVWVPSSGR